MDALRRVRQIRRSLCRNIIVRNNAVTFFRTYCASTTIQSLENNKQDSDGNNEQSRAARPTIDEATIRRIERLALVGFEYEQSKRALEEAITFAERLRRVQIDETVRPMYSTLENEHIHLRDDVASSRGAVDRNEILKNAAVLEEEYFVAPLMTGKDKSNDKQ